MKKPFCDVCGAPASDRLDPHILKAEVPVGEKYRAPQRGTTGDHDVQCRAVATAHFSFTDHRTGFGGPPDLCARCARGLLTKLLEEIPAT